MDPENQETPRKNSLRTGGGLLLSAAILFPFVSIVGRLMPSRENTTLDELPAGLLLLAVIGLGIAGVVTMAHALIVQRGRQRLAERDSQRLAEPPAAERIEALRRERIEVRD